MKLLVPSLMAGFGSLAAAAVIQTDVVVIGGGASGTYAAIQLQRAGKSVVLIEREGKLGGQVHTYRQPSTGKTFELGVVSYVNVSFVTDFFDYLGIDYFPAQFASSIYADFANQTSVSEQTVKSITGPNISGQIQTWISRLELYPWLTDTSGYHIPSTGVPSELFLSWGDYLTKYKIKGLATMYLFIYLAGNTIDQLTFYLMRWINLTLTTAGALTTADNQGIYDAALQKLGDNAYLNSTVTSVTRSSGGVDVKLTSNGAATEIHASQLIMSIPPVPSTLGFLDLTGQEQTLFSKFNYSHIWEAVVLGSSVENHTIQNFDPSARLGVPRMPVTVSVEPSLDIPGVAKALVGSPQNLTEAEVKTIMIEGVNAAQKAYQLPNNQFTIDEFNNHGPYLFTVAEDDIKGGFYDQVNALQGQTNTWWNAAAFSTQSSFDVWNFTRVEILPRVINSL